MIANTPQPPYYSVIFTSARTEGDNGYGEMAEKMVELAKRQDGFLGLESARNEIGITVSYWRDLEAIKKWKKMPPIKLHRKKGKKFGMEILKPGSPWLKETMNFLKRKNRETPNPSNNSERFVNLSGAKDLIILTGQQ